MLQADSLDVALTSRQEGRRAEYRREIAQTRQQRDEEDRVCLIVVNVTTITEIQIDTFILEDILSTWQQLKETRSKQGFSATQARIIVYKQETDKREDKAQYAK